MEIVVRCSKPAAAVVIDVGIDDTVGSLKRSISAALAGGTSGSKRSRVPGGAIALRGDADNLCDTTPLRLTSLEAGSALDVAMVPPVRAPFTYPCRASCIAVSECGTRAAFGEGHHFISVWNATSGEPIWRNKARTSVVCCVRFSPCGAWLASTDSTKDAILLCADTGRVAHTLKGHTDAVRSVAFTSDSQGVVSGSWDRTMRLWDVATAACLRVFLGYTRCVAGLAVADDRLVSCDGNVLVVWSVATGGHLCTLLGHTDAVYDVAASHGSTRAVSCSRDATIRVWDLGRGRCLRVISGCAYFRISFSVEGGQVAALRITGELHFWDSDTGDQLPLPSDEAGGVGVCGPSRSAVVTPCGGWLFTAHAKRVSVTRCHFADQYVC